MYRFFIILTFVLCVNNAIGACIWPFCCCKCKKSTHYAELLQAASAKQPSFVYQRTTNKQYLIERAAILKKMPAILEVAARQSFARIRTFNTRSFDQSSIEILVNKNALLADRIEALNNVMCMLYDTESRFPKNDKEVGAVLGRDRHIYLTFSLYQAELSIEVAKALIGIPNKSAAGLKEWALKNKKLASFIGISEDGNISIEDDKWMWTANEYALEKFDILQVRANPVQWLIQLFSNHLLHLTCMCTLMSPQAFFAEQTYLSDLGKNGPYGYEYIVISQEDEQLPVLSVNSERIVLGENYQVAGFTDKNQYDEFMSAIKDKRIEELAQLNLNEEDLARLYIPEELQMQDPSSDFEFTFKIPAVPEQRADTMVGVYRNKKTGKFGFPPIEDL